MIIIQQDSSKTLEQWTTDIFFSESFYKIKNDLNTHQYTNIPIVKFKIPSELEDLMNFKVNPEAVSEVEFIKLLDQYLDYSVKTGNKQFLNQLYSGFNFPAFIGEVFSVFANSSMYTYEVAPVTARIETEMIQLMNSYAGCNDVISWHQPPII